MTLPSRGGPGGGRTGTGALETATVMGGEDETPGGRLSFEQAAASAAPKAEVNRTRIRTALLPGRAPAVKSGERPQESTVMPSFSRSWRYGSLML